MTRKSSAKKSGRSAPKRPVPAPRLKAGVPLDWWCIFKFNAAEEPEPSLPEASNFWLKTRWDPADTASTDGLIVLSDFGR